MGRPNIETRKNRLDWILEIRNELFRQLPGIAKKVSKEMDFERDLSLYDIKDIFYPLTVEGFRQRFENLKITLPRKRK